MHTFQDLSAPLHRLAKGILRPLLFGNIPIRSDHADRPSFRVSDQAAEQLHPVDVVIRADDLILQSLFATI